jgi:hypothetical protein
MEGFHGLLLVAILSPGLPNLLLGEGEQALRLHDRDRASLLIRQAVGYLPAVFGEEVPQPVGALYVPYQHSYLPRGRVGRTVAGFRPGRGQVLKYEDVITVIL